MASKGCNFCYKVGSQPISNNQDSFNYRCLEVKKKVKNKKGKGPTNPTNQVCEHKWTKIISFFLQTKFCFWGFGQHFLRQVLGLLRGSRDNPIFVNYCIFITKNSQSCVQQPPFEPGKHGCYAEGCLKNISGKWDSGRSLLLQSGYCGQVVIARRWLLEKV